MMYLWRILTIDLNNGVLTRAGTQYLAPLTNLTHLNLTRCGVDDAALEFLSSTQQLQNLIVSGCPITGEGYGNM